MQLKNSNACKCQNHKESLNNGRVLSELVDVRDVQEPFPATLIVVGDAVDEPPG